ncbi:MAG: substrate-binding domain-containing protein [Bryobacterales bacterium]|nr:substrate-binding domain-containing protein [Bryobacterales bacterium]
MLGGVESVLRACEMLRAFSQAGEILRVQDLADRTRLHKATVSRLLLTLEEAGFVERVARRGYRSLVQVAGKRRLRIGYASQTETSLFAHEVTEGLRRASAACEIDLAFYDNRYDPAVTRRNADRMIEERVDVAIDFQTFQSLAQVISSKFEQVRIPLISVDLPVPGAIYYGANNYEAGRIAGRALARWAREHWSGAFSHVLLIELAAGGPLLESRMTGALAGLAELASVSDPQVVRLDGANTFEGAFRAVKRHLRAHKPRRTLILAMNDPNALGALEAFHDAGCSDLCAVAGQGATLDARIELRRLATRLIGSVAYFPERYGEALIRLALDILQHKPLPPAVYTRHRLVTARNVDKLYPKDKRCESPLLLESSPPARQR